MAIIAAPTTMDGTYSGTNLEDRIYAGGKDNSLRGFGGDDLLIGGAGRDRLIGGEGDDTLVGDGTSVRHFEDVFVFGNLTGQDVIPDFDVELDSFEIMKGLNEIKRPWQALDHLEQHGNHVVLDLGDGNTVKVLHVDLSDLSTENFVIV